MNAQRFFTDSQIAQKYKALQPSQSNPFLIYPSAVNKNKKNPDLGSYENPVSSISIEDGNTTQRKDPK